MSFQLDAAAVMQFSRTHKSAMLLMFRGTDDYVGARCCLLNGALAGLELAAQAVEKHLKAMLLFLQPAANVRAFSHRLPDLLREVCEGGLADLSAQAGAVEGLFAHYQAR